MAASRSAEANGMESRNRSATEGLNERVEKIRALLMNLNALLQQTNAAHLAQQPIESIHRELDRLSRDLGREPFN